MSEIPSFTIVLEQEREFEIRVKPDWLNDPDILLDEPDHRAFMKHNLKDLHVGASRESSPWCKTGASFIRHADALLIFSELMSPIGCAWKTCRKE